MYLNIKLCENIYLLCIAYYTWLDRKIQKNMNIQILQSPRFVSKFGI